MSWRPTLRPFYLFLLLLLFAPQSFVTQGIDPGKNVVSNTAIEKFYEHLETSELQFPAFYYAMNGYQVLQQKGLVSNDSILTLIDYSLPSYAERLFIFSIPNQKLLYKSLVAHGQNTGEQYATRFSNRSGSHQSSLGFFLTGDTYYGQNGYSLRLSGLDTTFNDRALSRAIVIHGADYVSEAYIQKNGRLGRSFGCPALPLTSSRNMIDLIKNGSVLFCYYPDSGYLDQSKIINGFLAMESDTLN